LRFIFVNTQIANFFRRIDTLAAAFSWRTGRLAREETADEFENALAA
jgi:hypothetical protein